MRRLTLTTAAVAAALALASCGGAEETPTDGGATSSETGTTEGDAPEGDAPAGDEMPAVDGEFGAQPTLTFPETGAPAELRTEILSEGDGAEVGEGDYIVANYIGQVWGADAPFNDSWGMGSPIGFSLNQVIDGWKEGIPGASVGDRVLLSIPSDKAYGEQGQPSGGIEPNADLVFVIDVLGTYPADSWFSQADAKDTGAIANLPVTVDGALGEQPTISVVEGAPEPTEMSGTVIAEGTGEPVGENGLIVLALSMVDWANTPGGDSWSSGRLEAIPVGQGMVFDSLVGAPTGSRAVMQMPAANDMPAVAAVVDVIDFIPTDTAE